MQRRITPGIDAIINNSQIFDALGLFDGIPYAGDEDNPRPMPKVSLYDFNKGLHIDQKTLVETWHVPDAMYFSFADKKHHWEMKEAITVDNDQLWDMVMPGDTVLLSDYVTHHYTGVKHVDRDQQRIYFSDPWPERFFLKAGLNTENIEADDNLGISREEYLRVIVGLVTLDTPDLLLDYLNQNPGQHENGEMLRRIGLALLDEGRDSLVCTAAQYLVRSYDLLRQSPGGTDNMPLAAETYVALKIAIYKNQSTLVACKPFQDKLTVILNDYNEQELLATLTADDLGRIAYVAAQEQLYTDAERYFDLAIGMDALHEYNLTLRASVRKINENYLGAIEDITQSLRANAINKENAHKSLDAKDSRDRFGIGRENSRLASLDKQYFKSLGNRCIAYISSQQLELAETDASAIIQGQAKQPMGYVLRSQIAKEKQDWSSALENLGLAQALENEPAKLEMYSIESTAIEQMRVSG